MAHFSRSQAAGCVILSGVSAIECERAHTWPTDKHFGLGSPRPRHPDVYISAPSINAVDI